LGPFIMSPVTHSTARNKKTTTALIECEKKRKVGKEEFKCGTEC